MNEPIKTEASEYEADIRRLELEIKQEELAIRRLEKEQRRNASNINWSIVIPLLTAILGTLMAFLSNTYVTYLDGKSKLALEQQKLQNSLIFEAVKTGDKRKALENLKFLVDVGYLQDLEGRISSLIKEGRTLVLPSSSNFKSIFPHVFFSGTPNNWKMTPMTMVSDHIWEIIVAFDDRSTGRFKFSIYDDWSENFGDNDSDGIADRNGSDIPITEGSGTYKITFNDLTKAYTIKKQ